MSDATAHETEAVKEDADEELGYCPDPDFVPNPADRYGHIETTSERINFKNVVGVFRQGERKALALAKRALDPEDDTPAHHVTLPSASDMGVGSDEDAVERLNARADHLGVDDDFDERAPVTAADAGPLTPATASSAPADAAAGPRAGATGSGSGPAPEPVGANPATTPSAAQAAESQPGQGPASKLPPTAATPGSPASDQPKSEDKATPGA
jgi:hypothetical protein